MKYDHERSTKISQNYWEPKPNQIRSFLVGVFEENARLLQWLVFFRQFNAIGPLFPFRHSEASDFQKENVGFESRTKPQVF